MLILEGPDGGGKSTLAEKISRSCGAKIYHAGGPPKTRDDLFDRIQTQYERFGCILDRAALFSDMVYGPVVRGSSYLDDAVFSAWLKAYKDKGFILVYCRPPVRVLDEYVREKMPAVIAAGKTYKEPEHAELVTSRIQQIALAYDELMERVAGEGMEVLRYVRP